jgi:flavodoxin
MKSLVVYYSRTGTTKKVAEAIADVLKCDIEEVLDTKKRSGVLGWLRSGRETLSKKLTTIEKIRKNPDLYDLIIIGTPVWNSTVSTPIRTYISQYRERFKEVAFLCTQGGSGHDAFNDMEDLCGKKPVAILPLRGQEVENGEYTDKVKQLVARITRKD